MSWLLAVALFAIGFVLMESSQFIGFLTILAGVFALVLKPQGTRAHAPAQSSYASPSYAPIIIKSGGNAPGVDKIKLRIKEPWGGSTVYEDFFSQISDVVLFPVKILWRLLRIGRGKK